MSYRVSLQAPKKGFSANSKTAFIELVVEVHLMSSRLLRHCLSSSVMSSSNLLFSKAIVQYSLILHPFWCYLTKPVSAVLKYLSPSFNSSSLIGFPLIISADFINQACTRWEIGLSKSLYFWLIWSISYSRFLSISFRSSRSFFRTSKGTRSSSGRSLIRSLMSFNYLSSVINKLIQYEITTPPTHLYHCFIIESKP
jgi:hypothetical protein